MSPSSDRLGHLQRHRDIERVTGERAGEQHVALRSEAIHDVAPTAQHRDREAVADRLAERRQVGCHAEPFLGAAGRVAEARDDLVEDQDHARRRARLAQGLEEARLGQHDAGVVEDRLEDHRGDRVALAFERLADARRVVVLADHDQVAHQRRDARRRRDRRRSSPSSVAKWWLHAT